MEAIHRDMKITDDEFDCLLEHLQRSLINNEVRQVDIATIMLAVASTRKDIVRVKGVVAPGGPPEARKGEGGPDGNKPPPQVRAADDARPPKSAEEPANVPNPPAASDKLVLPGDAAAVLVAHLRSLAADPPYRARGPELVKLLADRHTMKMLRVASLDPLKDIDTLIVSLSDTDSGKLFVSVKATASLDVIRIDAALRKECTVSSQGGRTVYLMGGADKTFITVADTKTLALSTSKDYLIEVLDSKVKPSKSADELKAALAKANPRSSAYGAVVVTEDTKAALSRHTEAPPLKSLEDGDSWAAGFTLKHYLEAAPLESITFSVNVTDVAQIDLLINTPDTTTANETALQIKQLLPAIKFVVAGPTADEIIDKARVGTKGSSVTLSFKITDKFLAELLPSK